MDTASIELPGTEIGSITLTDGTLRLHFPRARIIKTMTGSTERTLWWQAGELVIDGAQLLGPLPATPIVCAGGDIDANLYTYRDMIPLPLSTPGRVGCDLKLSDGSTFPGQRRRDSPRYGGHREIRRAHPNRRRLALVPAPAAGPATL